MDTPFTYHGETRTITFFVNNCAGIEYSYRGYRFWRVVCFCEWRPPHVTTVKTRSGCGAPDLVLYWEKKEHALDFIKVFGAAIKAHWEANKPAVATTEPHVVPVAVTVDDEEAGTRSDVTGT